MKLKLQFLKSTLIILLFLGFYSSTKATHLMGGEFTYRYLYTVSGVVYYETKLVIYRDCNSSKGFANPTTMGIYAASNYAYLGSRDVYMSGTGKDITPMCNKGNMCIEEGIYIDTLPLADAQNFGIYITCGATDRNNSAANLSLINKNAGIAWQIYIPAPKYYINNSPQFASNIVTKIATNKQTTFANNAYDIDGDSLVYSIAQPYGSVYSNLGTPAGYPVSIPLSDIHCNWANGYSISQPFGAYGSVSIDSSTGEITAIIPQANYYTLVVQIDEYRKLPNGNMIYMGETRRDFEIVGITIPNYAIPLIHDLATGNNKTIYANRNNCFNISATDSMGDTITISAAGIMFDTSIVGQQNIASFDSKTASGNVVQQFCWKPTCTQIKNTPYILTIDVLDKNCNHTQKCFSITIEDLLVDTITTSVCTGSSYNFNGKMINAAGTYIDSFAKSACNSNMIQVLNLSLGTPNSSIIYDSICDGAAFNLLGKKITTAGTYTDTTTNMGGCDSVITLNLFVQCCSYHIIYDTICSGSVYNFNGKKINASGNYIETLKRTNGCDSFIELQLYVIPSFTLGNIIGNQTPVVNDTNTYSIIGPAYIDYFWFITGGKIISGQGTNKVKVVWNKLSSGALSINRKCSGYSTLTVAVHSSINNVLIQPEILIYPNPSDGNFNINFGPFIVSKSEISIYNSMGQLVYNTLVQPGTELQKVELENISAGCYYIHIKSADAMKVQRMVINK